MIPTTPDNAKRCGQCTHFEHSKLAGFGYCKSARDFVQRARLLARDTVCLFLTEWSTHHA